jgi:drug/metabolite transporter (DMT)-like permease
MPLYALAMALTIVANITYHISQRSIAPRVHPFVSLAITYAVALLATLALLPVVSGGRIPWEQFRLANWASYVLAFGIVGLELGFLLAYRAGWNISVAALYSNLAVTMLLIPVGVLYFKERLSATHVLGIALSIAGLVLMSRR